VEGLEDGPGSAARLGRSLLQTSVLRYRVTLLVTQPALALSIASGLPGSLVTLSGAATYQAIR